jgi:hypothetical protein
MEGWSKDHGLLGKRSRSRIHPQNHNPSDGLKACSIKVAKKRRGM